MGLAEDSVRFAAAGRLAARFIGSQGRSPSLHHRPVGSSGREFLLGRLLVEPRVLGPSTDFVPAEGLGQKLMPLTRLGRQELGGHVS